MFSLAGGGTYRQRSDNRTRSLVLEQLEDRWLLALELISPVEVHMHELINWARAHPDQAAARYATPLNQGLPPGTITPDSKPPLARNDQLRLSIQSHLEDMQQNDYFSHTSLDGRTYVQRIVAAGYTQWRTVGENLAWSGTTGPLGNLFRVAERLVGNWFRSPGHRNNMMRPVFKEAGSSLIQGPFAPSGLTYNAGIAGQNFGTRSGGGFLTGVGCLARSTEYDICDVSRPVSQASVTAVRQGDGLRRQTITGPSGNFDLQLDRGTWNVEIVASGFQPLAFTNIVMAAANLQLDFTPQTGGEPPSGPRSWRNPHQPTDVSGDGVVAPFDASLLIDSLNRDGARTLPPISPTSSAPPPYYDPTGDNYLAPNDVLMVINYLNERSSTADGESSLGAQSERVNWQLVALVPTGIVPIETTRLETLHSERRTPEAVPHGLYTDPPRWTVLPPSVAAISQLPISTWSTEEVAGPLDVPIGTEPGGSSNSATRLLDLFFEQRDELNCPAISCDESSS